MDTSSEIERQDLYFIYSVFILKKPYPHLYSYRKFP